jgi:hypothetical protein
MLGEVLRQLRQRLEQKRDERGSLGSLGGSFLTTLAAPISITANTPVQNPSGPATGPVSGRDALITVVGVCTAASGATITAAVGPMATVAAGLAPQTIVPAFSTSGVVSFTLYVPAGWWININTTGSPTITFTGIWQYL